MMRTIERLEDLVRRAVPATVILDALLTISIATAANRPIHDERTLVVKLTAAPGSGSWTWAGKSGRPDFDRRLTDLGVTEVRQPLPTRAAAPHLRAKTLARRFDDFLVVRVPDGVSPTRLRDMLAQSPEVESVEFNGMAYIAGTDLTPNDPYFATHQYPLRNTGAQPPYDPGTAGADAEMEAAWDFTTGSNNTIVAFIDTGVDINHPEFEGRIWINPSEEDDLLDNDSNGYIDDIYGYNFVSNNGFPFDDHMHGTHTAGIAAATGNNGIGIAGMNWQCRIMALKVLDMNGSGTFDDVAEGIFYAVNNGANIINLSLGGPSSPSVMDAAIGLAIDAGVIVTAAMGNDNFGELFYPAAYDSVISVGATDSRDRRALGDLCPFEVAGSNFGPWIDVCAAGDVVWSTFPASFGNYGQYCLTSMASPHVAGLASLMLALRYDLSPDSVRYYIRRGAEDQVGLPSEDAPGFDIYHGWGRINSRITLQALALTFPPIITVPGPQTVTELDTLRLSVTTFDSNLTDPQLAMNGLPGATSSNQGHGKWEVSYAPDAEDAGVYQVEFIATDVDGNADTGEVEVTVVDGCACDCHADPGGCNGSQDIVDVVETINVAFRGFPAIPDPNQLCPRETTDVNCTGATDVVDVVNMVNVSFRGANAATEFCDPCL